jgi:hypothetical protein
VGDRQHSPTFLYRQHQVLLVVRHFLGWRRSTSDAGDETSSEERPRLAYERAAQVGAGATHRRIAGPCTPRTRGGHSDSARRALPMPPARCLRVDSHGPAVSLARTVGSVGNRVGLTLLTIGVLLALCPPAVSACTERAEGREPPSYRIAVDLVWQLPEVRVWVRSVSQNPPAKIVLGGPVPDTQSLIEGRCHWSVTLYSDEGPYLHRWNTFFVEVDGARILVADVEGAPMSLARWRAWLRRK